MEALHDPADVARLASTCRSLRAAADAPPYGGTLWRSLAARVVGAAATALHDDGGPPSTAAWRAVVAGALSLDAVHWSRRSARALQDGVADRETEDGGDDAATATPPPLRRALARSGHTATDDALGRVIVTGGVRRDGGTSGALDVVVVDARTRSVARPRSVHGAPPPARFRHAAVAVTPSECPAAADALVGVLMSSDGDDNNISWACAPAARRALSSGSTLLLFGGYAADGAEFGGPDIDVVWVAPDGSACAHAGLRAGGVPPAPRFHHTATRFTARCGGVRVALFGGEGSAVVDVAPPPHEGGVPGPPAAYVLDVAGLEWRKIAPAAGDDDYTAPPPPHPGPRALHLSTVRRHPVTHAAQLVIVGGYTGGVLQSLAAWALDLETEGGDAPPPRWHPSPAAAAEVEAATAQHSGSPLPPLLRPGDAAWTPPARQRAASWRVGERWLLVAGGSPPAGGFLADVQRLHLPTLTWRKPPACGGRPAGPARVAGHTLAGGVAFGGCLPTLVGVVPVARIDVLRLTAEPPPAPPAAAAAAAAVVAAPPAASPSSSLLGPDGAHFRVWRDTVTGRLYAERSAPAAAAVGAAAAAALPGSAELETGGGAAAADRDDSDSDSDSDSDTGGSLASDAAGGMAGGSASFEGDEEEGGRRWCVVM